MAFAATDLVVTLDFVVVVEVVPLTLEEVLDSVSVDRPATVDVLLAVFVTPTVDLGAVLVVDKIRFVVFLVSFSAVGFVAVRVVVVRGLRVAVVVVVLAVPGRAPSLAVLVPLTFPLSALSVAVLTGAVPGRFVGGVVLVAGVGRAGVGLFAAALGLLRDALGAVGVGGLGTLFSVGFVVEDRVDVAALLVVVLGAGLAAVGLGADGFVVAGLAVAGFAVEGFAVLGFVADVGLLVSLLALGLSAAVFVGEGLDSVFDARVFFSRDFVKGVLVGVLETGVLRAVS